MKCRTLLLTLLFCVVSPRFQPYACIGERAVKLKISSIYQATTDKQELVEYDHVKENQCTRLCKNFAFMFFIPPDRSEKFNCICFRRKDWHLINNNPTSCTDDKVYLPDLKVIPSDITSKPDSDPFKKCAPFYGFMLSCQQTESANWCLDLDEHLDSFDYNQTHPMRESFTFPQCMKRTDLKWEENGAIHTSQVNGHLNCKGACATGGFNGKIENHYYILQGDKCWCAQKDFLVGNRGFYESKQDCQTCNSPSMGNYEYSTCGNGIDHHSPDSHLSVYCGRDDCRKPVGAGHNKRFAYFGCVKKPYREEAIHVGVVSVKQCLKRCRGSETMYIKPNRETNDLTCICGKRNELSIEDMSLGCTDTWSPEIHGPTGSLANDQEGYALYCWPEVCKGMANQKNFYKESPGQRHKPHNHTTTTLPTTTETAATTKRCTTLRTSSATPSTTTTTTTMESTTTTISTTTTTIGPAMPENVTHPLKLCCDEKVDNRGMLWNATCGFHNLTTHCPTIAPGFALWTCDTTIGEFIPKQVRF